MTNEEARNILLTSVHPQTAEEAEAIGIAVGAILLLPVGQWIAYKKDCKKYGKKQADEIWRRMR